MSDATIIASELQDLASAVDAVAAAVAAKAEQPVVVNVAPPELPAPVVNVDVGVPVQEITLPPMQVTVPVPVVQVSAQSPDVVVQPIINVPKTLPNAYQVRITERDDNGLIAAFVIVPITT